MGEHYRVRIREGEFEVEVESSEKDYVEKKLRQYRPPARRSSGHQKQGRTGERQEKAGKPLTVGEFVSQVGAHSSPEYVVAVCYFLEHHENAPAEKTKDVSDVFEKIKYSYPNVSEAVRLARRKRWLMADRLVPTRTGEQWVEERLKADEDQS